METPSSTSPNATPNTPDNLNPVSETIATTPTTLPQPNKKILMVEDDTFLRDIYRHTFTKSGFIIDEATNGEEGVEKGLQNSYDLILLDIMMPKKNGIQVLQELRQTSSKAYQTPILLLSNLGQEKIIREAFNLGADGFILKADLLPRQVVDKVVAFLAGKLTREDFMKSQSLE